MQTRSTESTLVIVGKSHLQRAEELKRAGLRSLDALHVACAESAGCDVLLTTDDGMIRRSARVPLLGRLSIRNPITFLLEQHHEQDE